MVAKVHLVLSPCSRDNTDRLLARYQEIAAKEIGAAVWVAPTERARDDVLEVIARSAGAILAPRIETFPALAAELCGIGSASHVIPVPHQRMILAQLLQHLRDDKALPLFGPSAELSGFVDQLFGFISELKGLGVSPAEFGRAAEQIGMRSKDREVALIYSRFSELFTKHSFVDREAQYAIALKQLQAFPNSLGSRALFVDGFDAFTPPQLSLMREWVKRLDEVWISLPLDESDADRYELFSPAADTLSKLRQELAPNPIVIPMSSDETKRSAGLRHVATNLFRESADHASDVAGLNLIEAPGIVGECRMVARAVKDLLQRGVAPADVLVCTRDMPVYGELLSEVFAAYGIPLDVQAAASLARQPVVAALLAAARLDADDWPFGETTALLRCTLFRPEWSDVIPDADVVADAEILLRLLGEPRPRALLEGGPTQIRNTGIASGG